MRRLQIVLVSVVVGLVGRTGSAGLMVEQVGDVHGGFHYYIPYEVRLATPMGEEQLSPGDFITLHDIGRQRETFPGVFGDWTTNWRVTTDYLGVNGPQTQPEDDPSLINLTFTYTGDAPISGDAVLFNFELEAQWFTLVPRDYSSQRTDAAGPDAGTKIGEVGRVMVPAIPEPSVIGGVGVVVAMTMARRRR